MIRMLKSFMSSPETSHPIVFGVFCSGGTVAYHFVLQVVVEMDHVTEEESREELGVGLGATVEAGSEATCGMCHVQDTANCSMEKAACVE